MTESKNTNAQPACFNGYSSGRVTGNMKIPRLSLVDHDMVYESEQTKAGVSCLYVVMKEKKYKMTKNDSCAMKTTTNSTPVAQCFC